ncbi:hypothetical protein [Streptomyces sp. NPDC053431]|uniref:hypothetical protein n=1 Tax=Streptomyces sp. NPDC053431 TaxID=3365703 RepID=UPI0037CCD0C0
MEVRRLLEELRVGYVVAVPKSQQVKSLVLELRRPVTAVKGTDHLAGDDLEGGEESGRAARM